MIHNPRLVHGLVVALALLVPARALGQDRPVEMGRVRWHRNLDAAQEMARAADKPMLVLFQEIPGCETCQSFGREVLSHPLLVEAMEELFVPVVVYNNRKGKDAEILGRFKEPAWNNPVIRLLDATGKDLVPRADGVWSPGGIAHRLVSALQAAGREVPAYLQLLADERAPTESVVFAMHCFWEGEGKLGGLTGVQQAQAGWIDGSEVVTVKYAADQLDFASLLRAASEMQCTSQVFVGSQQQLKIARQQNLPAKRLTGVSAPKPAQESDREYYLRNSTYRFLPLTTVQATRVNAALYRCGDLRDCGQAAALLSPRQRSLLAAIHERLEENPHVLDDLALPEDRSQLGDYTARLTERLSAAGRSARPRNGLYRSTLYRLSAPLLPGLFWHAGTSAFSRLPVGELFLLRLVGLAMSGTHPGLNADRLLRSATNSGYTQRIPSPALARIERHGESVHSGHFQVLQLLRGQLCASRPLDGSAGESRGRAHHFAGGHFVFYVPDDELHD